jgi:hypothetical protein
MPRTFDDMHRPTQAEIDAAVARAHVLRSRAFASGFGALFRAAKGLFASHSGDVPAGAHFAR